MSAETFNRDIRIQFGLAHDCIRACVYADHIARHLPLPDAWLSLMDICYTDAVITWAQLFGTNAEESHWKRFVNKIDRLPDGMERFSSNLVVRKLCISDDEWSRYHREMLHVRNVRLAHLNASQGLPSMPNTTWAIKSCCVYREWLLQLLHSLTKPLDDPSQEGECESEMLRKFKNQIAEICRKVNAP